MYTETGISIQLERQKRQNIRLLVFVLLYTILAGAIRKWLLPGGILSNILLLGHIVLPWVFYFLAPGSKQRFAPVLLLFGGILVLLAVNPLNQSIYHGAFGLLLHMGFWLIAFHYLENRHLYPWEKVFGVLLLLFLAEVALGIVQYSLPRSHFINRYAAETATSIAYVGERARVTGTFSYVAGFTSWLFFANLWIWSLALQKRPIRLITILTAIAILASLISGARAALAFTLLFAFLMFASIAKRFSFPKILVVSILSIIIGFGIYQRSNFVQEAWSNFYSRIEDGIRDKEFGRRTVGVITEIIDYRGDYPVLGTGLGATYQGARIIWGESYFVKKYGGFEEEPERIVLEGGYLLFILRTLLLIYLLYHLRIPIQHRILFALIIIIFTHSIFNVYNIVFVPLGLSLLEHAYIQNARL